MLEEPNNVRLLFSQLYSLTHLFIHSTDIECLVLEISRWLRNSLFLQEITGKCERITYKSIFKKIIAIKVCHEFQQKGILQNTSLDSLKPLRWLDIGKIGLDIVSCHSQQEPKEIGQLNRMQYFKRDTDTKVTSLKNWGSWKKVWNLLNSVSAFIGSLIIINVQQQCKMFPKGNLGVGIYDKSLYHFLNLSKSIKCSKK
jgi:hypothetical protein